MSRKEIVIKLKQLLYPNKGSFAQLNQKGIEERFHDLLYKDNSDFEKSILDLAANDLTTLTTILKEDSDILFLCNIIHELLYSEEALRSPEIRKVIRSYSASIDKDLREISLSFLSEAGDPTDFDLVDSYIRNEKNFNPFILARLANFPEEIHHRCVNTLAWVVENGRDINRFHAIQALNNFETPKVREIIRDARLYTQDIEVLKMIGAIEKTWELGISPQDNEVEYISMILGFMQDKCGEKED